MEVGVCGGKLKLLREDTDSIERAHLSSKPLADSKSVFDLSLIMRD